MQTEHEQLWFVQRSTGEGIYKAIITRMVLNQGKLDCFIICKHVIRRALNVYVNR